MGKDSKGALGLRSRLRIRALPLTLAVLVGVLVGGGLFTAWHGEAASYLSNDPESCINCHIMREQYDGWIKGPHHVAATCNDCHTPHGLVTKWVGKARNGYAHSRAFTLQDFPEPIRITEYNAEVLQENCVDCHRDFVNDVLGTVRAPAGHPEQPDCVRCHRAAGHGPVI
jgi:cytochrome c nitrite reductase small subunit